jgi:hypothetical protein
MKKSEALTILREMRKQEPPASERRLSDQAVALGTAICALETLPESHECFDEWLPGGIEHDASYG